MSGCDVVSASHLSRIFSTLLVPKKQELVAAPIALKAARKARSDFFEDGFWQGVRTNARCSIPHFPSLSTTPLSSRSRRDDDDGSAARQPSLQQAGKQCLKGLMGAEFSSHGYMADAQRADTRRNAQLAANALASSIVLACRPACEIRGDHHS